MAGGRAAVSSPMGRTGGREPERGTDVNNDTSISIVHWSPPGRRLRFASPLLSSLLARLAGSSLCADGSSRSLPPVLQWLGRRRLVASRVVDRSSSAGRHQASNRGRRRTKAKRWTHLGGGSCAGVRRPSRCSLGDWRQSFADQENFEVITRTRHTCQTEFDSVINRKPDLEF